MKKVVSILLALGMTLSLVACGSAAKPTPEHPADITMWCIATESDSNHAAYVQAIADFQAAHPEINFTWEATQNEEYKTKIKAAAAANELPDIFFTWGLGFLGDFVKEKRVYCVDDVYKQYKDKLPEVMMTNHTFDGKKYAVPMTFNIVAMFCNMDILGQAGYTEVPKTWDELIACCDALIAKGIIPFGCSGKEAWCISEYFESIVEKSVGGKTLNDMYAGEVKWNNPEVSKAVDVFQEMVRKNYFDPEGIALGNDEVKANFMAGKYAFYINGTWNCADFAAAGLEDKVQVAEFPVIDSTKSQLGELIGGANDSLAISADSKYARVACEAAFELSKSICQYGYLAGSGLAAWTPDYPVDKLNKLTNAVQNIVSNSSYNVLFGDNVLNADNGAIYLDYISKAYALAVDGEQFGAGLDSELNLK